jgi:hypothetical protein
MASVWEVKHSKPFIIKGLPMHKQVSEFRTLLGYRCQKTAQSGDRRMVRTSQPRGQRHGLILYPFLREQLHISHHHQTQPTELGQIRSAFPLSSFLTISQLWCIIQNVIGEEKSCEGEE